MIGSEVCFALATENSASLSCFGTASSTLVVLVLGGASFLIQSAELLVAETGLAYQCD
jgi:hypothetical protein